MKKLLPGILLLLLAAAAAFWLFPRISMEQLVILTIPHGSELFINGLPSGTAPAVRLVPDQGVHVSASRDGFFPEDTLLEEIPDTLLLHLTQGSMLVINTIPAGCRVETGNYTGFSPCSVVVFPGRPVEITATGGSGFSVSRTMNVLAPGIRVVNITIPWRFEESFSGMEFMVIPSEVLPFAMGPMSVGRDEVTAAVFAEFMNSVDPSLRRDSFAVRGRTLLLDSIMRCNWNEPITFNSDTTAYAPVPGLEDHPVTGVTREGAEWFCRWLTENSATGLSFRLPDSDEWAALAAPGEDLPYNHSDRSETILGRNSALDDGWGRTAPSGALGYSGWGLGNMQGNVWEWIADQDMAAGGSWISSQLDCTSRSLISLDPDLGYPFTGFRVVAAGTPGDIIPLDTMAANGGVE